MGGSNSWRQDIPRLHQGLYGCAHFRDRANSLCLLPHISVLGASVHTGQAIRFRLGPSRDQRTQETQLSNALAYAILLIRQRQARNLIEQQKLQQLFLAFLAGEITAEQYERNLEAA
jgi:hypothetical protein